ncbi:MAG: hypothetical protein JEY99_19015 [Spirochaetales bacterium]|nr:hypothetical protein [Spirochaetales bacterium]
MLILLGRYWDFIKLSNPSETRSSLISGLKLKPYDAAMACQAKHAIRFITVKQDTFRVLDRLLYTGDHL